MLKSKELTGEANKINLMNEIMEKFNQIYAKYRNKFPISVIDIAHELGIGVYKTSELPDNISGFITKEEDGRFSIYVNQKHSATRKMFTIAHEVGHYVLHSDVIASGNQFITHPKSDFFLESAMARSNELNNNEIDKKRETEANKFAADLLMPLEEFKKIVDKYDDIHQVAEYFGVSCSAASIRAASIGKYYI